MKKFYAFIKRDLVENLHVDQKVTFNEFYDLTVKSLGEWEEELVFICEDINSLLYTNKGIQVYNCYDRPDVDDYVLIEVTNVIGLSSIQEQLDIMDVLYTGADGFKFDEFSISRFYSKNEFWSMIENGLNTKEISSRIVLNSVNVPEFIKNKYPKVFTNYEGNTIQRFSINFIENNKEIIDWEGLSSNYYLTKEMIEKYEDRIHFESICKLPEDISFDIVKRHIEEFYNTNILFNCNIPTDYLIKHLNKKHINSLIENNDSLIEINKRHHNVFLSKDFLKILGPWNLERIFSYNIYTLKEFKTVEECFNKSHLETCILNTNSDLVDLDNFTELYNYVTNKNLNTNEVKALLLYGDMYLYAKHGIEKKDILDIVNMDIESFTELYNRIGKNYFSVRDMKRILNIEDETISISDKDDIDCNDGDMPF